PSGPRSTWQWGRHCEPDDRAESGSNLAPIGTACQESAMLASRTRRDSNREWHPTDKPERNCAMHSANTLPPLLDLDQVGDHRYSGRPEHSGERRNVVFGGQILAQMIMAGHLDRSADRPNDLEVKSIHAIFARAGDYA